MEPLSMTLSDLWPRFQCHNIFRNCNEYPRKRHKSHCYYRTSI